ENKGISGPSFLFQNVSHHDFGSTFGIGFGVIEKIHAAVVSNRHQFFGRLAADLLCECDPGTERELAQLQSRFSEMSIFHKGSGPNVNVWAMGVNRPRMCEVKTSLARERYAVNNFGFNRAVVQLGRTVAAATGRNPKTQITSLWRFCRR